MSQYKQDIFSNNILYKSDVNLGFLFKSLGAQSFLRHVENPYFIWTGTGRIKKFEEKITNPEILNVLQNNEIYFYLYEPLSARIGDNFNKFYYSEFDSTENIKDIIVDEIESIQIFLNNHDIKNHRIFMVDYNIQLIKDNYPNLNIDCLDLYLRDICIGYSKYTSGYSKYTKNYETFRSANTIEKKFWCGNWRYTTHRHLITSYLSKLAGTYTWNLKCSYEDLEKNIWFDLDKFRSESPVQYNQLREGVDYLYNNQFILDNDLDVKIVTDPDNFNAPAHAPPDLMTKEYLMSYKNCFCAVANETRFAQPFGYFSEKTLNPMMSGLPVIVVAPPHTLKYLKGFGFKTYDQWWDESYDDEENHYKRMIKIFDVIDYINSKSLSELKEMYDQMSEIIAHNKEVIKTIPLHDQAV